MAKTKVKKAMVEFPNEVFVTREDDDDDSLSVWTNVKQITEGKIAVYRLLEVIGKRTVDEVKRKGSDWERAE